MGRRRTTKRQRRETRKAPPRGTPSLEVLEEFTRTSLARWKSAGDALDRLSTATFFELEKQRAEEAARLIEAVRSVLAGPFQFTHWCRVVDYRYSMSPLSIKGSVARDGGRFNIGTAINAAAYTSFPALYVAENFETAYRERFGVDRQESASGLSSDELVLRRETSFTNVAVSGMAELVIDVADLDALWPIAEVLRTFIMPKGITTLARKLRLEPPGLVRSAGGLRKQLLDARWRTNPVQYDLPSNSQIFGRLCAAAGAHGILFPSTRNPSGKCVALLPQNWRGGDSFLELESDVPDGVAVRRIDGSTETLA